MSTTADALAALTFLEPEFPTDDFVVGAVVVCKLMNKTTGRISVWTDASDDVDVVTKLGLLHCALGIESAGEWRNTDDDEP